MEFDPISFLEEAVQIESHNDVNQMREFLIETLNEYEVENRIDDAGNTIATRGQGRPHIVLNTHIDTVPPATEDVEFYRENGYIYGRGSCDAKSPLAALLSAFLSFDPSNGKVTLAVTPDEETLSKGATALDLNADRYIVGEPTGLDICNAAKGRFQGTIQLNGRSAHAAKPDGGINIIEGVCDVTEALSVFNDRPDTPSSHHTLGSPTLTPTTIQGGDAENQVPDYGEIVVDRRTVPPETSEEFEEQLEDHLQEQVSDEFDVSFSLTDRPTPFLEAFETPEGTPLVQTLQEASGGEIRPFTAAAEASWFAEDAPTVIFGPGVLEDEEGAVAHSEREYVSIDEVKAAAEAVKEALISLSQKPAKVPGVAD